MVSSPQYSTRLRLVLYWASEYVHESWLGVLFLIFFWKLTIKSSVTNSKGDGFKGGRVMIAFFVNYSTVAFPLHLPTLKRQQFFGAVANSLGKNLYFPLPLDVRRCVAPTGDEVDARQRGVN